MDLLLISGDKREGGGRWATRVGWYSRDSRCDRGLGISNGCFKRGCLFTGDANKFASVPGPHQWGLQKETGINR